MRPNGRKVKVTTECPKELYQEAWDLIDCKIIFEVEVLMNGVVSMTAEDPNFEEPLAIELCKNEPEAVISAVGNLVREAHSKLTPELIEERRARA